jgi:hypothetical protein
MHCARTKTTLYNSFKAVGGNMDPIEIYEDLKEKIIWLDVSPDSTLNQAELAETYGVSRNPITIALTRLDAEDLGHTAWISLRSEPLDACSDAGNYRNSISFRNAGQSLGHA